MSKRAIQIVLSASTRGWGTFTKAQKGLAAFNKEIGHGNRLMAQMRGQVAGLIGAYAGFETVRSVSRIITEGNTALFNLQSSLQAANRQFSNVGSLESWGATIDTLSDKLRIYSKSELNEAASLTLDMTKRLGLNEEQMRKVIVAAGDLGAGKFDLADSVERVTAALRGEAEASERLGLTLNETYVKGWYEAQGALKGAWKDLTDIEKAQVRYNVLLEQAEGSTGRASDSVNTLAGAYALAKANLHDAITEHEDLAAAMQELATYVANNAEEIGDLATAVTSAATAVGKFLVENQGWLVWAGKIALALAIVGKAIGTLQGIFKGLNAASKVLTGSQLGPWLAKLPALFRGAAVGGRALLGLMGPLGLAIGAIATVAPLAWKGLKKLADHQSGLTDSLEKGAEVRKRYEDRLARASEAAGKELKSVRELRQAYKEGLIDYDKATDTYTKGTGTVRAGYNVLVGAAKNSVEAQAQAVKDGTDKMVDD